MADDDKRPGSLISIVINNYNYGRFLTDAIDSALSQTYHPCEVVVIDDGSTDNSAEVIHSYGTKIKTVFKANGGQASAFNCGLAAARGTRILFLDADDYLYPNAVSRAVEHWREDIALVHYPLVVVDGGRNPIGRWPKEGIKMLEGFHPDLIAKGFQGCVPTSGNLFSRAALESFFPIEERFRICADAFLVYGSSRFGAFVGVDEVLGAYRVHGGNAYSASLYFPLKRKAARAHLLGAYACIVAGAPEGGRGDELRKSATAYSRHIDLKDIMVARMLGFDNDPEFKEMREAMSMNWVMRLYIRKIWKARNNPLPLRLLFLAEMVVLRALPFFLQKLWMQKRNALKVWLRGTKYKAAGSLA